MRKLKRFALKHEIVTIASVVDHEEIEERLIDYKRLDPVSFAKKYRDALFVPAYITFKGEQYRIQVNACTNPFCKWFGKEQIRFDEIKNKPYRYRLGGGEDDKKIVCNPDPLNGFGTTWDCNSRAMSNWALALEIQRLATHDSVRDWEPKYVFHREDCDNSDSTPFEKPSDFHKIGTSTSNSTKWRCKSCRKITNVLPPQRRSFSYHQKRNDILPMFATLLTGHMPVTKAIASLKIGSKTYYSKLELLYRRCLEFLERHESQAFAKKKFSTIWIDTDQFIYTLNNLKLPGRGNGQMEGSSDDLISTHAVVSADVFSRYVFRADVAYDWDVTLNDVEEDTLKYKDDHLHEFARKNARLLFSACPQPPSPKDTQSKLDYIIARERFWNRSKYLNGVHVQTTYLTFAHYWLIRKMINAKEWRFITDEDGSLMSALYRVFHEEMLRNKAHHFLCKLEKSKTRDIAFGEAKRRESELKMWGLDAGLPVNNLYQLAKMKLKEDLKTHSFYEEVEKDGRSYMRWAKNPLPHPLPDINLGNYSVDCRTDLSGYTPDEVTNMLMWVNSSSTNAFMQKIRRSVMTLERPIATARSDKRSYIYANANPKYAQYAMTILRTFYNFCWTYGKENKTPAQRIGITDKVYEISDIIYFR